MKFLAVILAFYIFALNLAPCEDTAAVDNLTSIEISQPADDHQHQGLDLCSPFCICHCCHIHATNFKIVDSTLTSTDISKKVFFYSNRLEKDFYTSILQPPQV